MNFWLYLDRNGLGIGVLLVFILGLSLSSGRGCQGGPAGCNLTIDSRPSDGGAP